LEFVRAVFFIKKSKADWLKISFFLRLLIDGDIALEKSDIAIVAQGEINRVAPFASNQPLPQNFNKIDQAEMDVLLGDQIKVVLGKVWSLTPKVAHDRIAGIFHREIGELLMAERGVEIIVDIKQRHFLILQKEIGLFLEDFETLSRILCQQGNGLAKGTVNQFPGILEAGIK